MQMSATERSVLRKQRRGPLEPAREQVLVRRLAERAPELAAEVGDREVRRPRERLDVEALAVAGVDQVLRAQQVPGGRDGCHAAGASPSRTGRSVMIATASALAGLDQPQRARRGRRRGTGACRRRAPSGRPSAGTRRRGRLLQRVHEPGAACDQDVPADLRLQLRAPRRRRRRAGSSSCSTRPARAWRRRRTSACCSSSQRTRPRRSIAGHACANPS